MAPEVLNNQAYTHKADVYSYAIVMYEILTRKTPYLGMNAGQIALGVVNNGLRPDMKNIPKNCPVALVKIMVDCWNSI